MISLRYFMGSVHMYEFVGFNTIRHCSEQSITEPLSVSPIIVDQQFLYDTPQRVYTNAE